MKYDDTACDWCLSAPKDWINMPAQEVDDLMIWCDKMPARFEVDLDGMGIRLCAEHYDAYMRGERSEWWRIHKSTARRKTF